MRLRVTNYVTEYYRQVIENGNGFTKKHMYILMMHLEPEQICQETANLISAMLVDCDVTEAEFTKLITSFTDENLYLAYKAISHLLF